MNRIDYWYAVTTKRYMSLVLCEFFLLYVGLFSALYVAWDDFNKTVVTIFFIILLLFAYTLFWIAPKEILRQKEEEKDGTSKAADSFWPNAIFSIVAMAATNLMLHFGRFETSQDFRILISIVAGALVFGLATWNAVLAKRRSGS